MDTKKREALFDQAYSDFAKGIFRFIYFKVSDFATAQDLTADTFVRFWKQLQSQEIEQKKALLYLIARGLIIDHYRKNNKRKSVPITSVEESLLSSDDDTEDKLATKQEVEQVLRALRTRKKEYQEVLLLHYVEDLTIHEIAFVLSKKENNVRVLLHRALQSLKEVYERKTNK